MCRVGKKIGVEAFKETRDCRAFPKYVIWIRRRQRRRRRREKGVRFGWAPTLLAGAARTGQDDGGITRESGVGGSNALLIFSLILQALPPLASCGIGMDGCSGRTGRRPHPSRLSLHPLRCLDIVSRRFLHSQIIRFRCLSLCTWPYKTQSSERLANRLNSTTQAGGEQHVRMYLLGQQHINGKNDADS